MDFIPIVAESLGGLAEDTISIVYAIGKAIAQRTDPESSSTIVSQLFHRFAITLWGGNARLLLNRQLVLPPPVDGVC